MARTVVTEGAGSGTPQTDGRCIGPDASPQMSTNFSFWCCTMSAGAALITPSMDLTTVSGIHSKRSLMKRCALPAPLAKASCAHCFQDAAASATAPQASLAASGPHLARKAWRSPAQAAGLKAALRPRQRSSDSSTYA